MLSISTLECRNENKTWEDDLNLRRVSPLRQNPSLKPAEGFEDTKSALAGAFSPGSRGSGQTSFALKFTLQAMLAS
jgi:hypothetical protein